MRRRPRYIALKELGVLDQDPLALAARGVNPFPPQDAPRFIGTGVCPKCGKYFPQGIHLHTRHCRGGLDQVPDYRMREQIAGVRQAHIDAERKRKAPAHVRRREEAIRLRDAQLAEQKGHDKWQAD